MKRIAEVGIGSRSRFYYESIASEFKEEAELVGFCDTNSVRMDYANRVLKDKFGYHEVPTYPAEDFDRMIAETKPDVVIVTSIDRTHHRYINRAMELGCDVITEKPLTMDVPKCLSILDTVKKTGRNLRVAFNYRYAPHNSAVKKLIMDGTIGDVKQVHFEWMLNTSHGADYFRRWHRDKRNSGGLLVHKATHHFDLVNFWLGTFPEEVFAYGDLLFYGKENAEERGITKFYSRVYGSENAKGDPFALVMEGNENMENLYLKAEKEDGYIRDQSVFGDNISIEDTMNVLVKYRNGARMSYSLNAYSPVEGFRVCFTGTKGRIELDVREKFYFSGMADKSVEGAVEGANIMVFPMFADPYHYDIEKGVGGHGGGDPLLLHNLFDDVPAEDPLGRAADYTDGVKSIMTGISANRSIMTGMPVRPDDLLGRKLSEL